MNDLLRYKPIGLVFKAHTMILGMILLSVSHGAEVLASELIKDPTAPLISFNQAQIALSGDEKQKKQNTSLILQGVLVENGRKIAVINNQLVRIGEEIEGYIVTSIVDYSAQLSLEEETLSLSLVSENIKVSDD